MNYKLKKGILLGLILIGTYSMVNAQQLLSKTTKTWKIHIGVIGGAGVSNYLNNAIPDNIAFLPEGSMTFTILRAPRPEGNLGLFTEIEPKGKFSIRLSTNYTMRAIPKPSFIAGTSSTVSKSYQSFYLNGLNVDGVLFFKPSNKIKIGLGFDLTSFLMTKKIKEGVYGDFAEKFKAYRGIKTVIAYNINPRTDINMYVSAGASMLDKLQFDNISAGLAISYKLKGREYKLQKEVYTVDYNKESIAPN